MQTQKVIAAALVTIITTISISSAGNKRRPYRLASVDLKQRVIWGAEVRGPHEIGLAFGGQDQVADDGRPRTRILVQGKWKAIHRELRDKNPLQKYHALVWGLRQKVKKARARARFVYFRGLPAKEETTLLKKEVAPRLAPLAAEIEQLVSRLPKDGDEYVAGQVRFARRHLQAVACLLPKAGKAASPRFATAIKQLHQAQIHLELAAEAFDAEPPARALDCGKHQRGTGAAPSSQAIIYHPQSKLYVLFGGDHLDYLTNDTWVFDPQKQRWLQRHPSGSPPPRANHHLQVNKERLIELTGGYTYSSNTDYVGGQYVDLQDGTWIYNVAKNKWSPAPGNDAKLVASDSRVYLTGPFHPDFFLQGKKPDAAKFEAWLKKLPANEWIATNPPYRPRLNRDWGTARIDPDRDLMLRWSGGHSAHGGTDVPHFHFSTNRWELAFPIEFPLGQLYSNTSYPNGFNFNLRPWITGHTYQNYAYDPPSKKMVFAGRPTHYYLYDPNIADWIGRGDKPPAMQYNSCFYTLTLAATPHGAACWDRNGRVHVFHSRARKWIELKRNGASLPGAYVDNSSMCYDSRRDRLLIINTEGYNKKYSGQVWSVDLKTGLVKALSPKGMEQGRRFANIDKSCYDAANDLMLLGTYLKDGGEHTTTPAYDCAKNRWVMLDLKYKTRKRGTNTVREFPHRRSDALMFDARRGLIWGTDTNGQVHVLRLVLKRAEGK